MSRFVAVLSVGRSGSSAVAGMIHRGGIPMGRNLIGSHPRFNAKGHYEDKKWHWLNRLIAYQFCPKTIQSKISNETIQRYPEFIRKSIMSDELMQTYSDTVKEFEQPIWGMKCVMLGLIWPYVHHHFGDDIRLIIVKRSYEAVIRSRMEHSNLSDKHARRLVDTLQEGIDAAIKQYASTYLLIHYESLLSNPRGNAELIADYVEMEDFDLRSAASHISTKLDHSAERGFPL